jgi:hypothetical protein
MAYEVKPLERGSRILGIFKQTRILATAAKDSRESELVGMAAAPVMARAIVAMLNAVTPEERINAAALGKAALHAAGIASGQEAKSEQS